MHVKVKRNADGVWYARAYLGTTPEGRKVRPQRSFPDAQDEEEAQRQADAWADALAPDGTFVRSTLVSDLIAEYVADREAKDVAPNTAKQWRMFARAYVNPAFGSSMAGDINAYDVSSFERALLLPKERGGRGLSRGTVANVHTFLSGAFDRWVELGVCDRNPMLSIDKPRADRHEAVSIDEWDFAAVDRELARILSEAPSDKAAARRYACALAAWISLHTGMRCGETCAVRRRDVSRRLRSIHVCGSVAELEHGRVERLDTKGRRSRNVSITAAEVATIGAACDAIDTFMGCAMGPSCPLVTIDGTLMRPSVVSRGFSSLRDRCGLPKGCTFHSLRHTHATWLLLSGVDVKTVSERLGHADEAITLKVYAHVMPGRDQAAAAAFERFAAEASGQSDGVPRVCHAPDSVGVPDAECPASSDGGYGASEKAANQKTSKYPKEQKKE